MAMKEACSGWCCMDVVWVLSFSEHGAVKTDFWQVTDLIFHCMHCSFAFIEELQCAESAASRTKVSFLDVT